MTNIEKLTKLYSMRSHKAHKVDVLLLNNLSHGYAVRVAEIAKSKGYKVTATDVRQIKTFYKADLKILNILIEEAQKEKAVAEAELKKLHSLIN